MQARGCAMKIQRIETFCTRFVGFVRVTSDDGAQGWGQVSTYHADISALILHRQVAPWALGQDALDIDALVDRVCECEHKFPGSHLYRAIGGVDTALWDLRGKLEGKPVCALARRPARPVARLRVVDEARHHARARGRATSADLRERFGFDAFKFRVGAEYGHDATNGRAAPRPSCPRCGAPWAPTPRCWSTPTAAIRRGARSKSARCCRSTASAISRNPAPTGNSSRPGRCATRWRST